ncbi:glycosyl transferase [Bradyrhizobium sp. NAS80.1]|uniref:glycosyltransferase n=1 Tax=Bradyrhizobium sp. NAS80.1 TaxID=1680159 RepID=UPI0009606E35|nr:glycosyltransferase [Bradyrhizobium sp. NAS80.1]OKO90697.1 glycosyl transferase [Bradyrhizobium sp. NAS80.1]
MKSEKPLISVIIPHLNQPDGLEACLRSLASQTLGRSAFEVIVVDNGSTSLPLAVVERYPGTILLQEAEAGPGPARNRGVQAASTDILAFTDSDCRAHPDWLSCALRTLRTAPQRTILGGDVRIWHEPHTTITALEAYECVFAYRFKLYIEQHGFCGTGNLVVRRPDFADIGPFRGIDVAEDIEWGRRARAAGYTFRYVPGVIVFHPARQSLRELLVKWDRHIQHAVNAGNKTATWQVQWVFRALAILLSPAVDWGKVVTSDRIRGLLPRTKAIAVLMAIRGYRAYKMVFLLMARKEVRWNRDLMAINSSGSNGAPRN